MIPNHKNRCVIKKNEAFICFEDVTLASEDVFETSWLNAIFTIQFGKFWLAYIFLVSCQRYMHDDYTTKIVVNGFFYYDIG